MNSKFSLLVFAVSELLFVFIFQASASAQTGFKVSGACGSAKVLVGDTCSNVKVRFDFEGCGHDMEAQLADRIVCTQHTIKARLHKDHQRFEAQFEKIRAKDGSIAWAPISEVIQFDRKPSNKTKRQVAQVIPETIQHNSVADTQPETPKAPVPDETPTTPSDEGRFIFSGFADLRYRNFTTVNDPFISTGNPESDFGIEDGAVYGNYKKGKLSVVLDMAFRRSKDIDIDLESETPNQSSNGNFSLGHDKVQLYLKYALSPSLAFDFGQFDKIFGVELNDSKDRVFGKTGIVFDNTIPNTHTGMMLQYTPGTFYFKTLAANPNNKSSYGTSAAGDDKTEYGTAIGFSGDIFRGQVGYMARPIDNASGIGSRPRSLLDVIFGATFGNFSIDFEYAEISDPSKNTLTPDDDTDLEQAGEVAMGLMSYRLDSLLIGARIETLDFDPGGLGVLATYSYGLTLNYSLSSDLELRSEYVSYYSVGESSTSWRDSRLNLSALFKF